MKAKIRKTGEIVEVTRNKYGEYVDENRVGYNLEDLIFGYEEDTHWQDVRERAAIAFMQSIISNPAFKHVSYEEHCMHKSAALADLFAKALVKQLKKEMK